MRQMATIPPASSQAGTKRKVSAAGLLGSTRPVKRRASKACHCCRSRKVRCDVVESGIPCTNCRLDEVECVVTEGKRRKKSYVENDVLHRSPVESIEECEDGHGLSLFESMEGLHDLAMAIKPATHISEFMPSMNVDLKQHHRPHSIYQTQGHRMSPEERSKRMSAFGNLPRLPAAPVQLPAHLQYHAPPPPRPEIVLPRYISPIARHILGEDLEYLQKKGAFQLPETHIRNELLRSYVQYVHPYLPLLDLEEFLSAIDQDKTSNTISLLLFHAVMFAASAYIDIRYLKAQGHSSRKAARKAYFQRVKLLYDFDWELERVSVVQSVLLMTHWYESPNDPKDVSYWLGIAVSVAKTIGMNYNTEGTSLLSLQKQRLWKRIWWCIYIRDRVIAIGLRRPIRVREEDHNIPMLELCDLETNSLPPEHCRMLGGCSAARDGSKRKTLGEMCISLINVCRLITNVLETQYTIVSHKLGITSETTVRLVQRDDGATKSDVLKCDEELENWYKSLPNDLRYLKPDSRERTNNHDGEVICVHRALLTAIYLTTSSALHRPQMMPATANLIIDPDLKELSQRRVHAAALDVTEIYRDLYVHDLIRYLPNTGVTVLLPAIIIHLLDIKSLEGEDKQTSMRCFQFCMQALQRLRDLYSSADFAFAFLDAAIKRPDGSDRVQDMQAGRNWEIIGAAVQKRPKSSSKDAALTPPPDSSDDASNYVDEPTLSKGSSYGAITPPSSDNISNLCVNSGISLSLKDLETFVGLTDVDHDEHNLTLLIPNSHETSTSACITRSIDTYAAGTTPDLATIDDFVPLVDSLVDSQTESDFFAPTQVSIDDNLFKDIDMEWLADSNDEVDESSECGSRTTMFHAGSENRAAASDGQLITPPDSASVSSSKERSLDPDGKFFEANVPKAEPASVF